MKRTLALPLLLCFGALPARATVANVSADASVTSTLPSTNFGTRSNLAVNSTSTTFVRFDLSNLPIGTTSAQVSKAVLYVYVNRVNASGTVSLANLSSSFSEFAVTSSNKPAANAISVTSPSIAASGFVPFDVTALVQGWVTTPASNYGVGLTSATADVLLDSKENDLTGHAAYVDVTVVNQGPQGPQGNAGSAGPTGPAGQAGPAGPQGATGTIPANYFSADYAGVTSTSFVTPSNVVTNGITYVNGTLTVPTAGTYWGYYSVLTADFCQLYIFVNGVKVARTLGQGSSNSSGITSPALWSGPLVLAAGDTLNVRQTYPSTCNSQSSSLSLAQIE